MGRRTIKPITTVFLSILGVTVVVWVLRGLAILSFLPGVVVWLLLLSTISAGVISVVHRTIR